MLMKRIFSVVGVQAWWSVICASLMSGCASHTTPATPYDSVVRAIAKAVSNFDIDGLYECGENGDCDLVACDKAAGVLELMQAMALVLEQATPPSCGERSAEEADVAALKKGLKVGWEAMLRACDDPERFLAAHVVLQNVALSWDFEAYQKLGLYSRMDPDDMSGTSVYVWYGLVVTFGHRGKVHDSQRTKIRALWQGYYDTAVKPRLDAEDVPNDCSE